MRVSKRAILALCLGYTACADSAQPPAADSPLPCERRAAWPGGDLSSGVWHRVNAPHGIGQSGNPLPIDAIVDSCEAIVSLAHDPGPGGKVYIPGPADLLWSADGNDWQTRDMATSAFYRDMAWGNGVWVAVGENMGAGVVAVSTRADASGWREVFHHDMVFRSVAFGSGVFVAVTQLGVIVSSDGERWHWAKLPDKQALYFEVAFGAGRFVVAGVGATLQSSDGEHWSEASCGAAGCPAIQPPSGPASTIIALQEIRYVGGVFYAFGGSGNMQSPDGLTWDVFTGTRFPDAAVGDSLLGLTQSEQNAGSVLQQSVDGTESWQSLPLGTDANAADCAREYCVVAGRTLLVFEPAPSGS